uniref:Cholesterol 25-hydroxylase n=1 Tax=Hucho hucho TaxID=62062 RepID=A0A4W5ML42_9TELE
HWNVNRRQMSRMEIESTQQLWDFILGYNAWLRSPFFPVLFSLIVYLTFCLPFVVLDLLSPQKSHISWTMMWSCLVHSLYNHVVFLFPLTVLHWFWRPASFMPEVPWLYWTFHLQMLFYVLNSWLSVEDHSGNDLPWSTHRLVPFGLYGGAPHHDLHHLKFKSNYAPYFTHWDRVYGTLHKHSE